MLRTYVIEAVYDWIVDHKHTPYILVDVDRYGVNLPDQYVDHDGKVLFNISPSAIDSFQCHNDQISFNATFDGELLSINIPVKSVLQLYSKEDSQGLYTQPDFKISICEYDNTDTNPNNSIKHNNLRLI